MRKTNDKEILDEEKKPATQKKRTTTKSSTTSKTTKSTKKVSGETTTKKTSSVKKVSKKTDEPLETEKKSRKKTATTQIPEQVENVSEKSKAKTTKKASSSKDASMPSKKSSSKSTSTKKAEISENHIEEKVSTTRKKKTSSKTTTKRIKDTEKTSDDPVYINPDILKFEKRLSKTPNPILSKNISEEKEILDIQNALSELEDEITKPVIENSKKASNSKSNKKSNEKPIQSEITKEKKKKEKKKFNANYIYNTIIAICIILIIYSVVNIVLWQKNNVDNSNLIKQVSEITPVIETSNVIINENLQIEKKSYDFTELLNQNPDTIGWIHINNTDIDYPIVKSIDNDFYLTHAFDKTYNAAGWIYADYRNRCDDTDTNLIIYGHNRLNDNMFGTLENVLSNPWLADENNHYINYSSLNKSHIYSIFSTFICTSDESVNYLRTNFSSNADFSQYVNNLKSLSTYDFNVNLTENDKIITLYTCHGLNNERLIVCGKLVN